MTEGKQLAIILAIMVLCCVSACDKVRQESLEQQESAQQMQRAAQKQKEQDEKDHAENKEKMDRLNKKKSPSSSGEE